MLPAMRLEFGDGRLEILGWLRGWRQSAAKIFQYSTPIEIMASIQAEKKDLDARDFSDGRYAVGETSQLRNEFASD